MLDKKVRFLQKTAHKQNSNGEFNTSTKSVEAFAELKAPTRTEFYQASQAGYRASAVIKVYRDTYNGAPFVRFDNRTYKIIRSYPVSALFMELTCEEVV
ncbi:MAG: phage head closure protein [Clostridia bacterium]|nr:phage head closure protein [Clostridia bacterium]